MKSFTATSSRIRLQSLNWLIEDIQENGVVTTEEDADRRPVPEFTVSP
ncbi:hypothetical protein PTW37_14670 [Arthrobacter agilis]|nr:hypothetical protein [Arthrobacter agilis]WDF33074.1 hypothetical protein PTW37_14670 [Arthrobacter agilis]